MSLINREALADAMYDEAFEKDSEEQKWDGGCWIRYKMFERVVFDLPSVDAVEVVRCKDCKFWHEDVANNFTSIQRGGCKLVRGITNGEFFCALGERKEINSR